MNYCKDCGCRSYDGACTNCHEEIYIEMQYHELNIPMPSPDTEFSKKLGWCHKQISPTRNIGTLS